VERTKRSRIRWFQVGVLSIIAAALCVAAVTWLGGSRRVPAVFTARIGILAPASVGGTEDLFVLDTGSEQTLVTPQVSARLLGTGKTIRVAVRPCVEPAQAAVFRSGGIRFAGARLRFPEEVGSFELERIDQTAGRKLGGILGWDVLSNFVVGIDISTGRMIAGRGLSVRRTLANLGVRAADAKVALKLGGGRPTFAARSGDQGLRLVLDTGAGVTLLPAAVWKRLNKELPAEGPLTPARDLNGSFSVRFGMLKELSIGSLRLNNLKVAVPTPEACVDVGETFEDGLLGRDALSRLVAVIDGPARILYLAKRPGAD